MAESAANSATANRKSPMLASAEALLGSIDRANAMVEKALSGPQVLDEESKKALAEAQARFDVVMSSLRPSLKRIEGGIDQATQTEELPKESPMIEIFGKLFKLETSLEARIDKNLGRLASLKEYKRFEASKRVALTILPTGGSEINP